MASQKVRDSEIDDISAETEVTRAGNAKQLDSLVRQTAIYLMKPFVILSSLSPPYTNPTFSLILPEKHRAFTSIGHICVAVDLKN